MQVDRLDRLAEFVLHFMASFMYTVGPHVGSCLDRKIYLSRNFWNISFSWRGKYLLVSPR